MRPEHSDNTYLQCLLLEVGFQDMKDEMRKRYEAFRREEAKPLVKKIGDNIPEYRRTVASGKLSVLVVVLTVICALLAAIVTTSQLEGSDRILAAVDSGGKHVDVLMEVLMEDRKLWTETSEETQDTPPGPEAATIEEEEEEEGAAKGTDHPPFETEAATWSVGTQASDSTTIPDDVPLQKEESLENTKEQNGPQSADDQEETESKSKSWVATIKSILYYIGCSAAVAPFLVLIGILGSYRNTLRWPNSTGSLDIDFRFEEFVENGVCFIGGSIGAMTFLVLGGLLLWVVATLLKVCSRVMFHNLGYSTAVVAFLVIARFLRNMHNRQARNTFDAVVTFFDDFFCGIGDSGAIAVFSALLDLAVWAAEACLTVCRRAIS
ncbi:unnamed protein product [Ectocarpus fasciculatus]